MSQSVPTSSHAQNLTGQTVNYFGPVLKGAVLSIVRGFCIAQKQKGVADTMIEACSSSWSGSG
jgi:hypothetical protein